MTIILSSFVELKWKEEVFKFFLQLAKRSTLQLYKAD